MLMEMKDVSVGVNRPAAPIDPRSPWPAPAGRTSRADRNIARLSAGPPGIPQDRLSALRDAYAAAVSDPVFLKKAQSLGLPVDPLVGQAVADAVFKALDQKPEMIEFLKVATKKKKD